jgi:hypothetical protein
MNSQPSIPRSSATMDMDSTNCELKMLDKKSSLTSWWWFMPVNPALMSLRQENHKFKTSLGYMVRHCL